MPDEPEKTSWLDSKALTAAALTALAGLVALSVAAILLRHRIPIPSPPAPQDNVPRPVVRPFEPGERLAYVFGWNDIPCAWAVTHLKEQSEDGARMLVFEYEGRTLEWVEKLWSYVVRGNTYLDFQTLLPLLTVRASAEKDKRKTITVTFDRAERVAETVVEKHYKNDRSVERVQFRQGLDLTSALVLARTLSLQPGDRPVLEVLHEGELYAVELVPAPVEQLEVKAGRFEAIPVDVRVSSLAGDEEEREETERRYRELRIWLSEERRLPLKMEARIFVGHVYAELVSVQPGTESAH